MEAKIEYKNPRARRAFQVALYLSIGLAVWAFVFAFVFGGGFWWAAVSGALGVIAVYVLAEVSGAYDETLTVVVKEDDDEQA